jgi:hypothetical protein
VATLGGDTLNAFASRYHANAIRYYERDDSYSVSDLNLTGVTKLSRSGELEWQARVGCSGPRARPCAQLDISGTHGHQVLENGNLLFFSASQGARSNGAPSPVYEYSFIEGSLGVIYPTLEWSYESEFSSDQFGDVQRLPNGNTLVTYSYHEGVGTIHEVSSERALVRSLTSGVFGYASFRERLYGPP